MVRDKGHFASNEWWVLTFNRFLFEICFDVSQFCFAAQETCHFWYNLGHTEMKRIRQSQMALQICRCIAAMLFAFAAVLLPLAARAEKANVFFIHGANVSEQDTRAWAAEMSKRVAGRPDSMKE